MAETQIEPKWSGDMKQRRGAVKTTMNDFSTSARPRARPESSRR